MDTQLQVLAKVLIELGVVILVLCDLCKHLQALLDDVLADNLQKNSTSEHKGVAVDMCT